MQVHLLTMLTLFGCEAIMAGERLELPPREAEILRVMPRVSNAAPTDDPAWLYRGSIRSGWAYLANEELKYGTSINPRKIELLRTLDKLRAFTPEDDLDFRGWDLRSIADKLGKPEVLPIPPRTVK